MATVNPLWPWLNLAPPGTPGICITQYWNGNNETGIDLGMPQDTPLTSLVDGQVLGREDQYGGGGVVSIGFGYNGATYSLYYQHLDVIPQNIQPGVDVKVGDLIGYSGGQLSGGTNPSSTKYSSGPHLEIGFNAPYGGAWHPLGANFNPLPLLQLFVDNGPLPGSTMGSNNGGLNLSGMLGTTSAQANHVINHLPGFAGVCQALDEAEAFSPWDTSWTGISGSIVANLEAFFIRSVVVVVGVAIVLAVLNNALGPVVDNLAAQEQAFSAGASQAAMLAVA